MGLTIRPVIEGDEDIYFSIYKDRKIMRFVSEPFSDKFLSKSFAIAKKISSRARAKKKFFVIENKAEQKVGILGFKTLNSDKVELGILLRREFHMKGYAAEAMSLGINKTFDDETVDYIEIKIQKLNIAAMRIAKILGFIVVKLNKDEVVLNLARDK